MSKKDRPYILWEVNRLQCPVINLSGEHYDHGFIETQAAGQPRLTHFYLELFLFLINRFQQKRFRLPSERISVNKYVKISPSLNIFFREVKYGTEVVRQCTNHL
jgi:hypothetical protein